jgi:acyl-CoA synthetase (NDP forming)
VQVPVRLAAETMKAALEKEIKFVHFFTSGFSEIGRFDLEAELLNLTGNGKTRIVGPNCLGVHCTQSGVTFSLNLNQPGPGKIAFLGQSGGVSDNFLSLAQSRGIEIKKILQWQPGPTTI